MTASTEHRDNLPTVGAIALIAMCLVCFDHEVLGHGGACLALGGRIQLATVSLFHCTRSAPAIDAAGPLTNLLIGGLALVVRSWVPDGRAGGRLFLTLVAAFSLFWEGGYLVLAMLHQDGDVYFAVRDLLGGTALWWRLALGALGVLIYGAALMVTPGPCARSGRTSPRPGGRRAPRGWRRWRGCCWRVCSITARTPVAGCMTPRPRSAWPAFRCC